MGLKVLMITHYFSTHRGGVEMVAGRLSRELAARGLHVVWLASDCDETPGDPSGVELVPMPAWNGLEQFGFPWPLWSLRGYAELWRQVRQADVVYLHDYIYAASILAFGFAKLLGKPVVMTQHTGYIPHSGALGSAVLTVLNGTLGRFMLGHAQRVVFISERVRRQFSRFTRFRAPARIVRNGVDTTVFRPLSEEERSARRQALGIPATQPVYLFVGRFTEKKGLPLLRELAASMPDVQWWLAGWGGETEGLHPRGWGLENVRVWEGLRGSALAELYQMADLFVLPSAGEGFPLVLQEAMACGTPLLLSAETLEGEALPAELVHGCPRFPEQGAVTRWQQAIKEATAHSAQQQTRRRVSDYAAAWDWQACAESYVRLFDELFEPSLVARGSDA